MQSAESILTSTKKFHINLGLSRTLEALDKLGNPHKNMQYIHVAGTNGKGSVCAMLNEIFCTHFEKKGISIGLFTSPHLFSYTERIKINNKNISKDDLNNYVKRASEACSELTEFEILTVAAFLYFSENNVKYVIAEVGLGGRFDSTNVIESPLCTIITTIDYDHTARLGNTIDEIAYQKAGIAKKDCNLVIAKDNKGFKTVQEYCEKIGTNVLEADIFHESADYDLALSGDYQKKNLALVIECINHLPFHIPDETIKTALKNVRWKFRLEYDKEKKILIDGAHNPSGTKALRDFLDKNFKDDKKTFIFGCLNNKDYENMLRVLVNPEDEFYFYEFDYPNSLKFEQLPESIKKIAQKTDNPKAILENNKNLKIVCGSLYMLGQLFNPG